MTVETRDGELRTSEEDYQRLFESLSDGAALLEVVADDAGTPIDSSFLDVNPAYEEWSAGRGPTGSATVLSRSSAPKSPAFELLARSPAAARGPAPRCTSQELEKHFKSRPSLPSGGP